MKFTSARITDIPTLHKLIERAYRGDTARKGWTHEADLLGGQRTDPEALQAIIEDHNQVILLAHDEDILIGCVQLSRVNETTSYLGLLTVDPSVQARGTGKKIMTAAERYVQENWHSSAMEMTVIKQRTELIAYYERRGYAVTGETRPFPAHDPQFGLPKSDALAFTVLKKSL